MKNEFLKKYMMLFAQFLFVAAMPVVSESLPSPVIAISCAVYSDETGEQLVSQIPELSKLGVNMIFIEINYSYQWKSHPELSEENFLSAEGAEKIVKVCNAYKIKIVPLIDCVGHQSWEERTDKLLETYPEFDETPGLYPKNKGIYCRSWCTQNKQVYPIIFDLIDELTEAFHTKFIHVGLDEIFLIGEDACPRCKGKDKGELLSYAINKIYAHCVKERGMTLFMWGDRLIDGTLPQLSEFGEWETSLNGTYKAIDSIPKDIVICDWHYESHDEYPSIPYFIEKGFRVLPASFKDEKAARDLINYSLKYIDSGKMIGHLYTTWETISNKKLAKWKPLKKTVNKLQ